MTEDLDKLECDFKARSTPLKMLEFSVMFLNITTALFGNLFTLIIVYRSPRLRTIPGMFVSSLAASDILMAIPSMALTLSVLIKSNWPFGFVTCQFQGYYGITLAFASSEILAIMSLNRYYRIVKPNDYRHIFSRQRTATMIAIAWLLASLVQLPYVAAGHRYIFNAGKLFCNQDGTKPFSTILISIFGGIPMSIISFCSFKVFRAVQTHRKQRFRSTNNNINVEDIRISRVLLVMVLAYVLCFSPAIIIESIDFFAQRFFLPRQVYFFYTFMATMSSSVNPVIYGAMNRTFRQEYARLFRLNRLFKIAPAPIGRAGFLVHSRENTLSNCRLAEVHGSGKDTTYSATFTNTIVD